MNFIIAVVSESYEKCMQVMSAESYRSKLDMIVECEQFMPAKWHSDSIWFPEYIILCRPTFGYSQTISGQNDQQWLGFIQEIKKDGLTNFHRLMAEIKRDSSRSEKAAVLLE
jgi:hypothetical protein